MCVYKKEFFANSFLYIRDIQKGVLCELFSCDPGGIRTHDPQLRRLLLYPAELRDQHLIS